MRCTINSSATAFVLSTGGFTGNLFHDYTGVLIPAFITAHSYVGEVQFLMSSFHSSPVACSAVRPAAAAAVGCVCTMRRLGYWRATYGRLREIDLQGGANKSIRENTKGVYAACGPKVKKDVF